MNDLKKNNFTGARSFTQSPSKDVSNGCQFIQIHFTTLVGYVPRLAGEEDVVSVRCIVAEVVLLLLLLLVVAVEAVSTVAVVLVVVL